MPDVAFHGQTSPSVRDQQNWNEGSQKLILFPLDSSGTSLRDFLSIHRVQDFLWWRRAGCASQELPRSVSKTPPFMGCTFLLYRGLSPYGHGAGQCSSTSQPGRGQEWGFLCQDGYGVTSALTQRVSSLSGLMPGETSDLAENCLMHEEKKQLCQYRFTPGTTSHQSIVSIQLWSLLAPHPLRCSLYREKVRHGKCWTTLFSSCPVSQQFFRDREGEGWHAFTAQR